MRKLFIACTLMLVLIALVGAVGNNGPGISLPKGTGITLSITTGTPFPIFSGAPVFDVVPILAENIVFVSAGRTYTGGIASGTVMHTRQIIENQLCVASDLVACITDIFIMLLPDTAALTFQEVIPLWGRSKPVESNTV